MPDDDKNRMAEKTKRQTEELKMANPGARIDVSNEKRGNVEVNEVRVSTEKRGS